MTKNNLAIIFEEVFNIMLFGYLTFLLIETLSTGFISNYFNLNYLLLVVGGSGVGLVLTRDEGKGKAETKEKKNVDFIVLLSMGIFSGALVYYKTKEMGNISFLIAGVTAILVVLLSHLQFNEEESN